MKFVSKNFLYAAFACPFFLAALALAQPFSLGSGGMGSGTNLSSVMYFDPPMEQKVKVRLSGAEMSSLPGTLYDVKKLKIEEYNTNGTIEAVALAPECIYAPLDGVASSDGPLDVTLGDGKVHVQGRGFMWQQDQSSLIISNQVHTIIKMGDWKLATP